LNDKKFCFKIPLPFPPTVNTYWRRVGNRTILSKRARIYREAVKRKLLLLALREELHYRDGIFLPIIKPCAITCWFTMPDRRRRDIDNLTKGLLDALEHAGVVKDDNLFEEIHLIHTQKVTKGGLVRVEIESL